MSCSIFLQPLRSNSNTPARPNEDNQLLWWFYNWAKYMCPLSLEDIIDFDLEICYIYILPRNLEFSRKFTNLPISPDMFPFLHLAVQYRNLISVSLAHCPAKISD
jgi:hypothetical protein